MEYFHMKPIRSFYPPAFLAAEFSNMFKLKSSFYLVKLVRSRYFLCGIPHLLLVNGHMGVTPLEIWPNIYVVRTQLQFPSLPEWPLMYVQPTSKYQP